MHFMCFSETLFLNEEQKLHIVLWKQLGKLTNIQITLTPYLCFGNLKCVPTKIYPTPIISLDFFQKGELYSFKNPTQTDTRCISSHIIAKRKLNFLSRDGNNKMKGRVQLNLILLELLNDRRLTPRIKEFNVPVQQLCKYLQGIVAK